jgi:uncharacterized membrane protein YqgA involved in biofilm formation
MIWLSIVGLVAGALLAQRFKIIVLLPAALVVAVLAVGAAAQMHSASLAVLTTVVATITLQIGYFVGIVVQYGIRAASPTRLSPSQPASLQDPLS